jgi:hypothetical protein
MALDPNTVAPAAEAPVSAPSVPAANPASAPALGDALVSPAPGAAPSASNPQAVLDAMKPFQDKEQAATQKAADIANTPVTAPNVPHARLMNMVAGLGAGLSGFGTAIATHGKEGGAAEVQQIMGARQEQQIQAQAARTAQKNSQIQQQLMVADTNHKLAQNILFMATAPDDITAAHLKVSGEQQAQAITGADFQASHGGMTPDQFSSALSGPANAPSSPGGTSFFTANAQSVLRAASTAGLPDDNPAVQRLQSVLANPKASAKDVYSATQQLGAEQDHQGKAIDERVKRESASAAERPKSLDDAVGRLSQAQVAYAANPTPANKALVENASQARESFLSAAGSEARIKQSEEDGDPSLLATGLVHGDVAWSQIVSTRRPEFAAAAYKAANALSMKETGKPFSAIVNESNFKQATNPQVLQKLKMIEGMTEKGGSIDIAKAAMANLPQMDENTANKVFNAAETEFGSKNVTDFHTAMLGLADEYSQVMGAGGGSDTSRQQALDLLKAKWSAGQLSGAVDIMQKDINARKRGLVNGNPALEQLFPSEASASNTTAKASDLAPFKPTSGLGSDPGAKLMQVPGYPPRWIDPTNQKAAANAGAQEVK